MDSIKSINKMIAELRTALVSQENTMSGKDDKDTTDSNNSSNPSEVQNKGRVIFDAIACP